MRLPVASPVVIPELRASAISGTQGHALCAFPLDPGYRVSPFGLARHDRHRNLTHLHQREAGLVPGTRDLRQTWRAGSRTARTRSALSVTPVNLQVRVGGMSNLALSVEAEASLPEGLSRWPGRRCSAIAGGPVPELPAALGGRPGPRQARCTRLCRTGTSRVQATSAARICNCRHVQLRRAPEQACIPPHGSKRPRRSGHALGIMLQLSDGPGLGGDLAAWNAGPVCL
jgi:hypothetical protein